MNNHIIKDIDYTLFHCYHELKFDIVLGGLINTIQLLQDCSDRNNQCASSGVTAFVHRARLILSPY